jgi:hypothetical protein
MWLPLESPVILMPLSKLPMAKPRTVLLFVLKVRPLLPDAPFPIIATRMRALLPVASVLAEAPGCE